MVTCFENDFLVNLRDYQLNIEKVFLQDNFPMHRHSFSEIILVLEGTAFHTVGHETFEIEQGDVFVVDASSQHAFEAASNLIIINFSYNEQHLLLEQAELRLLPGFCSLFLTAPKLREKNGRIGMLHLNSKDLSFVKEMGEMLITQLEEKKMGYEIVIKMLFQTVVAFLAAKYAKNEALASQSLDIIAEASAYMKKHFAEELTLEVLAKQISVSSRHLERLFRKYCMETPMQYLTEIRMNEALKQLSESDDSISDIAIRCGFSDPSYFSRVFKKHYQITPHRYRDRLVQIYICRPQLKKEILKISEMEEVE